MDACEIGYRTIKDKKILCMDKTIESVLNRVASGRTTEQDALLLHRCLFPDEQTRIVEAYLTLSCNIQAARQYLAPDLRQELADKLTRER